MSASRGTLRPSLRSCARATLRIQSAIRSSRPCRSSKTRPVAFASMLRTVNGSAASARNSTIPNGAGNLASGGNAPVATGSGNFPRLAGALPASSVSPGGSSTRNRAFSGNGPSNTAPDTNGSPEMSSGRTGARGFPSAARRTIFEASDRSTGAENSSRIGRTGRQSPPFFSRSQRNSTVKAGRTRNDSFRDSSEATPPAVRTPAPHHRATFAPGGNACAGWRTRIRRSAAGFPLRHVFA